MDCVENMFYVSNEENQRFVPWHGLGEPVEKALTSAEAIKMAGLDWEFYLNQFMTVIVMLLMLLNVMLEVVIILL